MQRLFDIIIAVFALILLIPLLVPVIIILRLTGEGEVFYFQNRIGKNKVPFDLIKFATMKKNSPNIGAGDITIKNDPRVLIVGKFLRKTKINELPQLWNIVTGQMSFIGPRPLTDKIFAAYDEQIQTQISNVRPGLSGIGSIIFRSEEKIIANDPNPMELYRKIIAPYKGELERWFTKNNSISTYFKLIFLTIIVVVMPSNQSVWSIFKSLPLPKGNLSNQLKYNKM